MDVKGIKVGLVGIYELYDHLEREQQLKDNIAKVKADGAQLIVVIFHWGNETETVPDSNQTTLGRIAIDEGADLVCGHHPHVLQGIETYKGKNIVYSLGNFCFGGNSSPSDMDTMIYQQTFTIDADGVKKDNVTNIIPCSISSAAYDGYNNYQPTPAEGDEATRILGKINERSSWISTAEGSTFTAKYNSNNDSQSSSADTAASDSDIVDINSSASDDTDAGALPTNPMIPIIRTPNKIEPSFIQNHIHTSKELKNPVKDFSALFYIFTMLLSSRMKSILFATCS